MTKLAILSLLLLGACTPAKPIYALAEQYAQANNGGRKVDIAGTIEAVEEEMGKKDLVGLGFEEILQKSIKLKDEQQRADLLYRWLLQTGKEPSDTEMSTIVFVTAFGRLPNAQELATLKNIGSENEHD